MLPAHSPVEHLARVFEHLPAGAYTCDPEGLITWFNSAAVAIWGREPARNDRVDRYCGSFKLFAPDGEPIAHERCWMARAISEKRAFAGEEIVIERPSGERIHALAYAQPIHADDGLLLGAVNVLVDVSEQKRAELALRESQAALDDFFEQAAVPLHWVDARGIILRANQAELDLLGYPREEYEGRPIAAFHADEDAIDDILQRLLSGETLHNYEARLRHSDGSLREVRITSNGRFENGELLHTRCVSVDVTQQKVAERLLQEADRRKDEFLSMLAHELRNPLAPIRNAVELMRLQGPPNPELDVARNLIDRQVTHLTRLVDDLLDVARITRGRLWVRPERLVLDAAVKGAVESVQPLLDQKNHELVVDLPSPPLALDADPVRLTQIFLNLLVNAARYTDPGGHIELRATRLKPSGAEMEPRLRVLVRDDGSGIASDEIDGVFEMFAQGKRHGVREGLGIGLTLVRKLVELHGGSVSAHSAGPGQGSEFCVELPIANGPDRSIPETSSPLPAAGRRVLVVDDNHDAAESLSLLLQMRGHEVRTAHAGGEALEEATRFRPEAILLDVGLPDMDGYETCRRIREQPWGRDILLVAITGWGEESHKRRAREAGFDHHMTKPAPPDAIQQLLARDLEPRDL